MMLPGVELQTSFLKDLVTATNPTSPWSFMAYLVAQKRFYEFLNADFGAIPRQEFASYLAWVGDRLVSLRFASEVDEVNFDGADFRLAGRPAKRQGAQSLGCGRAEAQHTGLGAVGGLASRCFHNAQAAQRLDRLTARRIAVIGGGQSGAEVVLHLLSCANASRNRDRMDLACGRISCRWTIPRSPTNCSRRNMSTASIALPQGRREAILEQQILAGDGASTGTLQALYKPALHDPASLGGDDGVDLSPHREVLSVTRDGNEFRLVMRNGFDGAIETRTVDAVILATGYAFAVPDCMSPLLDSISLDERGHYRLNASFEVRMGRAR